MRELSPLKKQIVFFAALGAWVSLAWGVHLALQEIIPQQWLNNGLWRLALWHTQDMFLHTWPEVFLLLLPLLLPQLVLPRRFAQHAILTFTLLSLWNFHWLAAWVNGYPVATWYVYQIKKSLVAFPGTMVLIAGASAFGAALWLRTPRTLFSPAKINSIIARIALQLTPISVVVFLLPGVLQLFISLDRTLNTPTGPNVLFIVVDTLRADHIGTYGYTQNTTPHLDQFAKDCVVFQNAISTAPWTTPSISAMLTSRYPREYTWRKLPTPLRSERLLLSELFRNANYQTTAFVSHYYIRKQLGFFQGFDLYDDSEAKGHRHISGSATTQKALTFLEQKREQPFFLFLHFFDPHYDYFEHTPYVFFPEYTGDLTSGESNQDLKQKAPSMSADDLRFVRALYDSEIRLTDENIHQVLEHLKKLDLYDNTLIVFVADHGEEFSERGKFYIGHGDHLYQELIHVPFFMKLPQHSSQVIVHEPVSFIDLAPTVAHYANLPHPKPPSFQGQPILLDGERIAQASPIFSETTGQISFVSYPWKLLVDTKIRSRKLYHLRTDPQEKHDRASSEPELVAQFFQEIERYEHENPTQNIVDKPSAIFSQEEIEQLKAMGYIE